MLHSPRTCRNTNAFDDSKHYSDTLAHDNADINHPAHTHAIAVAQFHRLGNSYANTKSWSGIPAVGRGSTLRTGFTGTGTRIAP